MHHKKLTSLAAKKLIEVFQDEIVRFNKYGSKTCRKLAARIQNAFELILRNPVELAAMKSIDNPASLRDNLV